MKWITRERPKIDRIACPWLIKSFVDKEAEFIYVPFSEVLDKAKELDAIPFDIPNVEFTHYEEKSTFDYIVKKYEITDRFNEIIKPKDEIISPFIEQLTGITNEVVKEKHHFDHAGTAFQEWAAKNGNIKSVRLCA